MDTVIDDCVCPIGLIQQSLTSALIATAAPEPHATGQARRFCRTETLDFRVGRNLAAGLKTLARTTEPTMMAFFLPDHTGEVAG
jgi:hypothetical protein